MTDYSNSGTGGDIQQKVSDVAQQAGDRLGQAGETIRGQVGEQVGSRSTDAGQQVVAAGDAMHQAGRQLREQGNDLPAQLAEQVAAQADRLGTYLRESDGETILRDVEDFARRQPWLVAGVGFAVGIGVARLLKASGRRSGNGGSYSSTWGATGYPTAPSTGPETLVPEPSPAYAAGQVPVPPEPAATASPAASPFARPVQTADDENQPPAEGWR